jgi:hypothetical protein
MMSCGVVTHPAGACQGRPLVVLSGTAGMLPLSEVVAPGGLDL